MLLDSQPSPLRPRDLEDERPSSSAALECDWCGAAVPRELVARRTLRRDDDGELVVVCAGCERDAD